MNIRSTEIRSPKALVSMARTANVDLPNKTDPVDQMTFSHSSSRSFGRATTVAGLGLIPGVGAFVNTAGMLSGHLSNNPKVQNLCLGGTAANVAGTLAGAAFLLTGNEVARHVAVGCLAASGGTAALGHFLS